MKIGSVKIRNFRSILKTDFELSEGVTALAGGNESGKSNVLLGLEKFLNKTKFDDSDTYQLSEEEPSIEITFNNLTLEEQEQIKPLLEIDNLSELKIQRVGNDYKITSHDIPELPLEASPVPVDTEEETPQEPPVEQDSEEEEEAEPAPSPSPEEESPLTPKEIKNIILDLMPKARYIGFVESVMTGENIPLAEIYPAEGARISKDKNDRLETIRAFLKLGNITEENVKDPDLARRTYLLQKGAAKIGEKLRGSWTQEDIKLKINADSDSLAIFFRDGKNRPKGKKEKENDVKWIWTLPEHRSSGFRWYITFYVRYLAELETSNNVLFLVDDAGAPLNKVAQEDLLKELKAKANKEKNIQIVYSTHSNHMVNWDFRKNIRLVEKQRGGGTKVKDMWWANYSPDKLPSPLREIGFVWDEDILKRDNLVLEGLSDVYVFHNLPIKFDPDLVSDPYEGFKISMAGGAPAMKDIGHICRLKGKKAFLLYDSDQVGLDCKNEAEEIEEEGKVEIEDIAALIGDSDYKVKTIEDLLPVRELLDSLNHYGKLHFEDNWNDIRKLHGSGDGDVISLIKDRLARNDLGEENIRDFFKSSKYVVIVDTVNSVSRSSYRNEDQIKAVIKLFKAVQEKLNALKEG